MVWFCNGFKSRGKCLVHPHTTSIRFKMDCSNAISSLGIKPLNLACLVPTCRFFCIVFVLCTEILAHDDAVVILAVAAVRLVTVTNNFDAMDN